MTASFVPATVIPAGSAVVGAPASTAVIPQGPAVVGVSFGHFDDATAEHWLASLPVAPVMACTHLVREPYPHVALSLVLAPGSPLPPQGEDILAPAAELAAAAHRDRRSGRAVIYPGVERLVGVLSVADLLAVSAIERVHVLGGAPVDPQTLVDTRDFVRPQWMDGVLTLVAAPAPHSRLTPFEHPNPTPCCADHP
jgi:hypothetical protein